MTLVKIGPFDSGKRAFVYQQSSRNHRRYTLCGYHRTEEHPGRWTDCKRCKTEMAETEMYVSRRQVFLRGLY